jgi:hypothetical protein
LASTEHGYASALEVAEAYPEEELMESFMTLCGISLLFREQELEIPMLGTLRFFALDFAVAETLWPGNE